MSFSQIAKFQTDAGGMQSFPAAQRQVLRHTPKLLCETVTNTRGLIRKF